VTGPLPRHRPRPRPRPHDLVALRRPAALDGTVVRVPDWVAPALRRTLTVVVRRAPRGDDRVPVGVRGSRRDQRHGTWVRHADIARTTTPEHLAARLAGGAPRPPLVAALLTDLARELADLAWGPVGSVGFELATGVPAVRPTSDVDLLVRGHAPDAHDWGALAELLVRLGDVHGRRLDCQVDTGLGGVHLDDLAGAAPEVLLRTDAGPLLVADPWSAAGASTPAPAQTCGATAPAR
jgi:phosphoribosyl-dephospho-CoA transferase